MRPAQDFQRARATELRKNMTGLEKGAWKILRERKEQRFRRQVLFDEYILDFYSPRFRLCVEIDGPLHDENRDSVRDHRLAERGVKTIRFNEETIPSMESVIEEICLFLKPRYWAAEAAGSPSLHHPVE